MTRRNQTAKQPKKRRLLSFAAVAALCLAVCLAGAPSIFGSPNAPEETTLSAVAKKDGEGSRKTSDTNLNLSEIPKYSGQAAIPVHGNKPSFSKKQLRAKPGYEHYGSHDSLGRCTQAFAMIGIETMPTEERGAIGMVKPSGWHTIRYSFVDGKYLYNRCHLIGYQLSGENANEKNLITGTRSLNIVGMLPYENEVADYVERTGNHVAYRVTPLFKGEELVCRGVQIEARSIEDKGKGVCFNVFCYNVEPGVAIDYATGESKLSAKGKKMDAANDSQDYSASSSTMSDSEGTFVVNINTNKFHRPTCSSVDSMADKNKKSYKGKRSSLINNGYAPCKNCNP